VSKSPGILDCGVGHQREAQPTLSSKRKPIPAADSTGTADADLHVTVDRCRNAYRDRERAAEKRQEDQSTATGKRAGQPEGFHIIECSIVPFAGANRNLRMRRA